MTESTLLVPPPKKTWGENLSAMWHHVSTYVALGYTTATGVWLSLDPATQAAAIAVVPGLKWIAPVTAAVAFIAAKGLPQKPRE
jgi:hypothetical protein